MGSPTPDPLRRRPLYPEPAGEFSRLLAEQYAPRSALLFPLSPTMTATGESLTADDVRRIVREELDERLGTALVPAGAELRRLYRGLTGEEMDR